MSRIRCGWHRLASASWLPHISLLKSGQGQTVSFAGLVMQEGLVQASQTAFVLVAGGLGERLGYSGIKVCGPLPACSQE
jgi:hypothetical protein